MSKKELIPEQPKPKAEVKQVLADKTKCTEQGKIVQK
jgi:hypothetical protein